MGCNNVHLRNLHLNSNAEGYPGAKYVTEIWNVTAGCIFRLMAHGSELFGSISSTINRIMLRCKSSCCVLEIYQTLFTL